MQKIRKCLDLEKLQRFMQKEYLFLEIYTFSKASLTKMVGGKIAARSRPSCFTISPNRGLDYTVKNSEGLTTLYCVFVLFLSLESQKRNSQKAISQLFHTETSFTK